jgi:hypothetical protein
MWLVENINHGGTMSTIRKTINLLMMDKIYLFLLIVLVIAIIAAIIIFRSFKNFFQCLYSFIFSGGYVFWKKSWDEHFNRSMRFTGYILIVGALSIVTYFILKYWIK